MEKEEEGVILLVVARPLLLSACASPVPFPTPPRFELPFFSFPLRSLLSYSSYRYYMLGAPPSCAKQGFVVVT